MAREEDRGFSDEQIEMVKDGINDMARPTIGALVTYSRQCAEMGRGAEVTGAEIARMIKAGIFKRGEKNRNGEPIIINPEWEDEG